MDKWLIIINPTAGKGKAKGLQEIIERKMKAHEIQFDTILTRKAKDSISIIENSLHKTVIAVGGDGTINEVAQGIIIRGYGVLGIIPAGTGNDLCKSLNIPLDPLEAMDLLLLGHTKEIDIGRINKHEFINIASAGFDGEVVRTTNRVKAWANSNIAYILGVLITLIRFRRKRVVLDVDGKTYERNLVLLAVGNGKFYGGGMKILPDALMDDGNLHICLVRDATNLTLLRLFPTIFKGKHIEHKKYVELFKGKKVKIYFEGEVVINFDGEIRQVKNEVQFTMIDKKLTVLCKT